MARNLKKVELVSIDEGRFVPEINEALTDLQREMIAYSDKYGDKAAKAKGVVTVTIAIGCAKPAEGMFAFATQIKKTIPPAPVKVTLAIASEDSNGEQTLFARSCGTGRDTPQQGVFTKEDGETVEVDK